MFALGHLGSSKHDGMAGDASLKPLSMPLPHPCPFSTPFFLRGVLGRSVFVGGKEHSTKPLLSLSGYLPTSLLYLSLPLLSLQLPFLLFLSAPSSRSFSSSHTPLSVASFRGHLLFRDAPFSFMVHPRVMLGYMLPVCTEPMTLQ